MTQKFAPLPKEDFEAISKYIDTHFEDIYENVFEDCRFEAVMACCISDELAGLEETFATSLLKLISTKNKDEVEIYKKANVDRKLFSKIRSNPNYSPRKSTAIAFCIALELDHNETTDLLEKAGYTLSRSSKFDIIIEYFIKNKDYDIYAINQALYQFGEDLLKM